MADLAFGISKSAVQLLADKVKSAIKEEEEQWQTVQRDLVFITGEFEMMQSFLDTATEEHVKNKIVRTWVRQVRDLSHDVEDNIDFVLNLDMKKRSWWLRLLPSCGSKTGAPLPVDEAVAETTLLRARVVDVSQRNIRYNLIADSASKPMAAMDLALVQKTAVSSFDVLINAVKKSGHLDLVGLISREDRDLQVVSVCGTEGDLVKVATVRKMYSDARIQKEFQCRAWVKLVHPFNPLEFIRSLVTQFFRHSCQEQEVNVGLDVLERMQQATQGGLIKEFAQKENNNRYLIVLEDLCTMVQWDDIRSYLPDRNKGSRIVVLTHHPVVASQCTGEPCRVSELGQFSPGHDSVRVYYKEGFQHGRVHSFIKAEPYHSLFSYDLLGRDTEMDELFELTQKSQESRLISVWGIPGVGKSDLVEAIYRKLRTSHEFKTRVWVSVSNPFNPTDFCRSLLVNLHRESTSSEGQYAEALFRAKDPIKECRDHLRECVYLLVIDGVQSHEDWDWIKSNLIQYGDSRSCIFVITSEESVAKHCAVSIDGVYHVKGLQDTAAMELFGKALGVEKERDALRFEGTQTEHVLSKCGGLPRVIITVARYLSTNTKPIGEEMRRLNDNFMYELATNPEFDSLRDIQAWMHSYLDACPRHRKKCMMYLSIFPQDIIIRPRRLIRRWVAEGYAKGTDSNSMEKFAEKMFDEVAALSIMQPVVGKKTTNKVIGYRVNGFFREYVMSRPVDETIFFPVEVSVLEKQGHHGHGRLATDGIAEHLAIGSTWENDPVFLESLDFSRLRSLTVFRLFWPYYVSDRMRVLRVLDLESALGVFNFQFERIGKLPSRLKFLSLRGRKDISKLPESVADLFQLQTLDIRDTSIVTLPPFITKLRKLQYIRAGTTVAWTADDIVSSADGVEEGSTPPSTSSWSSTLASCWRNKILGCGRADVGSRSGGGVEVLGEISRLKALQTLGTVWVNGNTGVFEIFGLYQLKKLQVSGISGKHPRWYLYLTGNTHMESLSLQFESNNHFGHWEHIRFPTNLRSLKVYGHVEQLPRRIKDCENLKKLTLEMTTLFTSDVIDVLGRLPKLQILRLRINKYQDHELQFPATELLKKLQVLEIACKSPATELLKKLQVLEIACKSKLHLRFNEGAMEKLEHLNLHCLEGSEMQVSGLEHPVSLKQVCLLGSFDDALKEAVEQQLAKHPKIPAPKLKVQPRHPMRRDRDSSSSEA